MDKNEMNEEYLLFKEYKATCDTAIRDELLEKYMYIAEIMAKRYINRGIEYEDIYQVAVMGILYAIDRFDADKGVKFATYATPTVNGEIRRYFRDKGSFIKIPRTLYEIFAKAEKIKRTNGELTSNEELARILNLPVSEIEKAYSVNDMNFIKSLEDEAYADGDMNFSNVIGREDANFLMIEDKDFLRRSLATLDTKELLLIKKRYFENKTQTQIAKELEISQMQVSRIERETLKKLRNLYFRE